MVNENPTPSPREIAQAVAGSVEQSLTRLFGAAPAPNAPATAQPGCTLRYGTITKFVPQSEFRDRSVSDLFDAYANDLSLGEGDVTYREAGGSVCTEDTYPQVGKTYIASVNRETKGWFQRLKALFT